MRLRHRRLCLAHCRLEGKQLDADRLRVRCAGIGAVRVRQNETSWSTIATAAAIRIYKHNERLADAGIENSPGSKGDSYDKALAETINGLYKAELIHRLAPSKTREAGKLATLGWVFRFNHHHLLEPLGYITPAEAEANYYKQLSSQANPA